MRHLLQILLCCLTLTVLSASACAQDVKKTTTEKKAIKEEKIETVWEFTKYLGAKLGGELKTRLNMNEGEKKKETVKVSISLGRYKVERMETRSVSGS